MILTTLDTSDISEAAVTVAAEVAVAFDEPLALLLVIDGQLRHHFDEIGRDADRSVEAVAQGYLDDVAARLDPVGVGVHTTAVHATDAAATIVEAASDPGVRMVVMATHGRSGIGRVVAGSVTTHVLRHVGRPVLVVPPARSDVAG